MRLDATGIVASGPDRMVWISGCSLACGSAMRADGTWCTPMAEGLPALLRSGGW